MSGISEQLIHRFHGLSGSAAVAMALVDGDGVLGALNPAFANLLGVSPTALQGRPLRELLMPEDLASYERLRRMHARRGVESGFHWIELRWLIGAEAVASRVSMGLVCDGTAASALVLFAERKLKSTRLQTVDPAVSFVAALCQQVVYATAEPLMVADAEGRVQLVSRGAQDLFRLGHNQLSALDLSALFTGGRAETGGILPRLALALEGGQSEYAEVYGSRSDGSGFTASVSILPLESQGERLALLRVRDLTEEKRREEQLIHLAHYDAVTGLPNRSLFADRLGQALRRAQREAQSVVLMFLDLDRFKHFNETLGHRTGDTLLADIAARLRLCLRDTDTLARLGGDEFAVVLEGDGALANAGRIALKVLEAVAQPAEVDGRELFLTASIGIALYSMDGANGDELLRHAEMAMYRAKDLGRNTYCFYAPAMNSAAVDRLQIESDLRRALERGEFVLYYQPQVDPVRQRVVGLEALLRWQRHDRLVPPTEFVPILEDTRLIVPVGEWILETACRQAVELEAQGAGALKIAVNISAHQFRDPGFVDTVARVLAATGLAPQRLDLEITETLLMEHTARTHDTLTRLDALGVRISLDDFGTGYSSLAYLKRFPVDTLKIDRSFIAGIPHDQDDVAIATAIIALAEQLELQVVAEAVETEAQLNFLRRWERILVQGYLFAPPLPAEALAARMAAMPAMTLTTAAGGSGETGA